jgi:hypothetical protein
MYLSKLNITKHGRVLACVLALSAVAAPAASALPSTGYGSPDAADNARNSVGGQAESGMGYRTPDAYDAARGATGQVEPATPPTVTTSDAGGFDWSTAGISVAAFAGLLIVSIAGMRSLRHAKREALP